MNDTVKDILRRVDHTLLSQGATWEEIRAICDDGVKYGYRTENPESYDELIRKSRSEGFGREVKRRILLGTYALSSGYYDAYYKKAMAVRQQIKREYDAIFEKCDVILTPTTPTVAYKCNENIDDPVKMYLADICTVTANIGGIPSISVPCGINGKGHCA